MYQLIVAAVFVVLFVGGVWGYTVYSENRSYKQALLNHEKFKELERAKLAEEKQNHNDSRHVQREDYSRGYEHGGGGGYH